MTATFALFVSRLRSLPSLTRCLTIIFVVSVLSLLNGCSGHQAVPESGAELPQLQLQGKVMGGQQPISGAVVQLYAVSSGGDGAASSPLIAATVKTLVDGTFTITGDYTCPAANPYVYLVAAGGNPGLSPSTVNNAGILLMAALGQCSALSALTFINLNEVTTVAAAYALSPFAAGYDHIGYGTSDASALVSAFNMAAVLVNTQTGLAPGSTPPPNGFTVPVSKIYTLADAVASCVNTAGGVAGDTSVCGMLYTAATPPNGTAPTNIADALANIAAFPSQHVTDIFNLASATSPFQPVLVAAPSDWTIVMLPSITLAASSTPLYSGGTVSGTITLAQAAPAAGLTVTLTSSDTTIITVATTTTVAAGATTGTFSYTSAGGTGAATISAVAPNYAQGTVSVTPSPSRLTLNSPGTFTPGQTSALPVSLSNAVAQDTVVTLALSSPNPAGVFTLSATSVTIPAGSTTPAGSATVTANVIGTATVTASATGFGAASQALNSTVTATLPSPLTLSPGTTSQTLSISSAAPAGGISFSLASSNTAVATVPSSVTIPQGSTSTTFTLTAVAGGTATITASSFNITSPTLSVTVAANINAAARVTGFDVETYDTVSLSATPAAPVSVTITSNNPAIATLSKTVGATGTASITYTGVTDTSQLSVLVQGQSIGSATYTVTATGYTTSTQTVAVYPTGLYLGTSSFSTDTLSSASSVQVFMRILDPSSFATTGIVAQLNPNLQPLSVTIVSSNTAVGTTAPASFTTGQEGYGSFTPTGEGTSTLSVTEPTGFMQPSGTGSITATVAKPVIQDSDTTSGVHVQSYNSFYLPDNPASATTFTVTIADPTIAVVTADGNAAGAATATYNVSHYGSYYYGIQGQRVGTTTITVSGAGFTSVTNNITVNPSGFFFQNTSASTTTFSSPSNLQVTASILDPNSLAPTGTYVTVNPDVRPLTLQASSSNTAVGTVSSATFTTDNYAYTTFTPAGSAGTATISIVQPSGFTTPSSRATSTVTVTAPAISDASTTTSYHTQEQNSVYLGTTPPSGVTMTLTIGDTTIAKISGSATVVGSGSLSFTGVANTNPRYFYIQGQAVGYTTLTISAPGFQTQTSTITVYPTGIYYGGYGSLNTTTLSSPTAVSVYLVGLAPGNFNPQFFPTLNPDAAPLTVSLASSNTGVGTISSTVTFNLGEITEAATFTPVSQGSTTLSVVAPAGFNQASSGATIAANVSPGSINTSGDTTIGTHLEQQAYFNLNQTPPSPTTVTISIGDTSVAVLSKDPTVIGSSSLTYTMSDTSRPYFWIQGKAQGSTVVTISAPGYASVSFNVSVERSGFIMAQGNFSIAAGGATNSITIESFALRSDGNLDSAMPISPDIAPLSVTFASSNPAAGTLATLSVPADSRYYHDATFTSGSAGQTVITIQQPTGFVTPAQEQSFTVTVQ